MQFQEDKKGPVNNFVALPAMEKWWCVFLMLIGRLELFTVLILMRPFFWRNRENLFSRLKGKRPPLSGSLLFLEG